MCAAMEWPPWFSHGINAGFPVGALLGVSLGSLETPATKGSKPVASRLSGVGDKLSSGSWA